MLRPSWQLTGTQPAGVFFVGRCYLLAKPALLWLLKKLLRGKCLLLGMLEALHSWCADAQWPSAGGSYHLASGQADIRSAQACRPYSWHVSTALLAQALPSNSYLEVPQTMT